MTYSPVIGIPAGPFVLDILYSTLFASTMLSDLRIASAQATPTHQPWWLVS